MKLDMQISGITPVQLLLRRTGPGITNVFKSTLADEMEQMKELAQKKLEEASISRTGKRYWTGRLQKTIKSDIVRDTKDEMIGVVGINVQKQPGVKHYAVPVEKGHPIGISGRWWEGYHFMQNTYLELAPGLLSRVSKVLNKVVATPWGWRNIATGQFTKGPKNIKTGKFTRVS